MHQFLIVMALRFIFSQSHILGPKAGSTLWSSTANTNTCDPGLKRANALFVWTNPSCKEHQLFFVGKSCPKSVFSCCFFCLFHM